MAQLTGSVSRYPARASLLWYLGLVLLGALCLWSPFSQPNQQHSLSILDAVFTATSAACVTGLVVVSTEHAFSPLGQLFILALIQLGGIGIMTVTTFVVFQFGRHESLRTRAALSESLGADEDTELRWILRNVILVTFMFEGAGTLILGLRNLWDQPPLTAFWHALFHSVSAFCNAGFALHDDSLMQYQGDLLVNITIGGLIIVGGIGFPVMLDLRRQWYGEWTERWHRLTLHSKLTLIGTGCLLSISALVFCVLEWDAAFQHLPMAERPIAACFHAVSSRTAGFNTIDISSLTNASLFITILLMLIGAGACSTAGGLKVSTLMVLICRAQAVFRGRQRVNVFRRTISRESVDRAIVTAMLFIVTVFAALTALLVIEQSAVPHPNTQGVFLDALFEVASALGTVGLSTGMTPHLTSAGRVIIILVMFLGRLGPISVFAALCQSESNDGIEFPSESPLIG